MRKRWFVYRIYPSGRGVASTHDELNSVRMVVESNLRKLKRPYQWFTLFVKSESVMFGVKADDGTRFMEPIENELKKDYPNLLTGSSDEDPANCELMAIATQCRIKIEDKIPLATWKHGQIGFIVHCMLNPYGFDNEAWTYWTSLCCIDEDIEITDLDTKDVIMLVRSFLEYKKGMEIEDDYVKLEALTKELEAFSTFLKKKIA